MKQYEIAFNCSQIVRKTAKNHPDKSIRKLWMISALWHIKNAKELKMNGE